MASFKDLETRRDKKSQITAEARGEYTVVMGTFREHDSNLRQECAERVITRLSAAVISVSNCKTKEIYTWWKKKTIGFNIASLRVKPMSSLSGTM
jgi:hypothetical protein